MSRRATRRKRSIHSAAWLLGLLLTVLPTAHAANSVSTWDAADFRIWAYIPYWANAATIGQFDTNGMYGHVSDVLYFGAVRPNTDGDLLFYSNSYQTNLATLRGHAAEHGFGLHLSVFEVMNGATDATWTTVVNDAAKRARFVNDVVDLMRGAPGTADDLKGFNFDWERPRDWDRPPGTPENDAIAAALWGNYTQLAREVRAAINPLGMEVSVCDYGSTDTRWDNTAFFDAKVYDQLFMMSYHLTASSSGTYANQKLNLTGQGTAKAFSNDQIAVGFGTYGTGIDPDGNGPANAPPTYTQKNIAAAHPDLPYDLLTLTEGSNSWKIESRKQIREKTQLALDRNMPGIFSWTLHYDATNDLGLHRVGHHYTVFQRSVPDLNLDGKVDAADADTLANNMGTVPGWTGTNTAARFDDFYLSGNWEQGDRDGNGFVNQNDADWLASRFTTLGVNIPDRLAFSGTFENFQNSRGLTGRWRAKRETAGNLRETGNYTQHGASGLTWTGSGVGASIRSNNAATIRNQNSAEAFDSLNTAPRVMSVDLTAPIDTAQAGETYVTFLVRQNTAGLLSSQLSSANRILSLDFLNSAGVNQFDFALRGQQQQFAIESQADAAGQDVSAAGFAADTTYLFVGKIAGNGAGANTMQASLFVSGSTVGNFASASFPWAITALGSAGFNPIISQLQFTSLYEASYTVSNVWVGTAADFFALPSAVTGDFNADGKVDMADYLVWRKSSGQTGHQLAADANGNGSIDTGDYDAWQANFGKVLSGAGGAGWSPPFESPVPEPSTAALIFIAATVAAAAPRSRA